MIRRAYRWAIVGLVPAVLAGCATNPEDDPFIVVVTFVAYAAAIGLFSFLVYRAIWGEDGPR
ncbi:MAG TPA: hypothetical protein VFC90_07305 [Planctomycetota bacterium]|nr:hypothetical protein [Planctomycetota bacterium]